MKTSNYFKTLLSAAVLGTTVLVLASFTDDQSKEWVVPDEYQKMANPVAGDDEATDVGSELYAKHCRSCHGKFGEGDGTKSEELDTPCGDFTDGSLEGQSDGALFYKIKNGRDEMPKFSKKISDDEDIWSLVNFIKTLAE